MIKYQKKVQNDKNYYPQVFLEKYKFVVKRKKMPDYITADIKNSCDDSDREDSDKKSSDGEKFDEEN